jgi:hypothetical protein
LEFSKSKNLYFDDSEIKKLEEMVLDEYINDEEKIYMHFALGKAYEGRFRI